MVGRKAAGIGEAGNSIGDISLISRINGRTMHGEPGVRKDLHWRHFPAFLPLSKRHEAGSFQEAAASPFSIVKFSLIRGHITRDPDPVRSTPEVLH